ncbi:recombination mediator RecR [Rapidithrix thailandica]|uniref:Recombination protein RecR n=1 Tax=Rapidithrix thailandica TaxID=413964 RepID=A0AAW9S6T9_9BACT
MNFQSKLIENAVEEIAKLPGIGKKTALRLVLHLLKQEEQSTSLLTDSLLKLRKEIKACKTCYMIGDTEECSCGKEHRDQSVICVVEDIRDVIAIDNTAQYRGMFHVLGGIISPIEGVSPKDLNIEALIERVHEAAGQVKEIIMALPSTMEGDTTAYYIGKKLKEYKVKVSTIARGVPIGSELEFTDEITLGRSIQSRVNYDL